MRPFQRIQRRTGQRRSVITALIPPGCSPIDPLLQIKTEADYKSPLVVPPRVLSSLSSSSSAPSNPPERLSALAQRPVVALGKFDAMHLGHRLLAEEAAKLGGYPWLLSFSGMDKVLGWAPRKPVVAPLDRPRILQAWAPPCGGLPPLQRYVPFNQIRSLSPEDFVALLRELGVRGVVTGANYRFGFKAKGDVQMLRDLGRQYGLEVRTVDLLESGRPGSPAPTSSSAIREAIGRGDMEGAAGMLGRRHRLVMQVGLEGGRAGTWPSSSPPSPSPSGSGAAVAVAPSALELPTDRAENLAPGPGRYAVSLSAYAGSVGELMGRLAASEGPLDLPGSPDLLPDVSAIRFEGLAVEVRGEGDAAVLVLPEEVGQALREHSAKGHDTAWTLALDF